MINKDFLKEHYNNIFIKNKEKICQGGVKDDLLSNVQNGERMSIVLLIRISPNISANIEKCINKLKEIESDSMYFYPSSDFHITIIDILKGEIGRKIPENINDYINCINECAKQIKPFEIEFEGLTASDNAVLVKGFYDNELQKFRELLRESLSKNNLKLEERYKTISSHITIARNKDKLKNPEKLISFIENESKNNFGKMKVDSFELCFHNWYDTKKQAIAKINL
jgi:2'-5' RNA ligase